MSARRQACEQYAPVEDCRSQARQKSGDQSMSVVMVMGRLVAKLKNSREAELRIAWRVGRCEGKAKRLRRVGEKVVDLGREDKEDKADASRRGGSRGGVRWSKQE